MLQTILIIEDDESSMKLFNDLLCAHNYRTIMFNGQGCSLSLIRKHQPDLILMDVKLPGRTGIERVKVLKAEGDVENIPVIALTAHAMKGDGVKFMEAGFNGYITKPINIHSFLETVATHLK